MYLTSDGDYRSSKTLFHQQIGSIFVFGLIVCLFILPTWTWEWANVNITLVRRISRNTKLSESSLSLVGRMKCRENVFFALKVPTGAWALRDFFNFTQACESAS